MRPSWTSFSSEKINALDIGRGIAIVSVMYGHALSPWFVAADGYFSEAAFLQWKFGASFMMAFFFFLSGVGWREDKSLAATTRQALALVLITLFASIAYNGARLGASMMGLAPLLGGQGLDFSSFAAEIVRMVTIGDYYSFSALWFLVALAMVRVLAALSIRARAPFSILVAIGLLTLTLVSTQLGWRNFYQVNLIGIAFAFFLAGHAARDLFHAVGRRPAAAYALLLIGGVVLVSTFHLNQGCRWDMTARCGEPWLGGRFGVTMIFGHFGNLPLFAITAIAGVAFASALSILLARFGGVIGRRLDAWGGNSLDLLVVNCLFLHVGNTFVERWIAPNVAADSAVFFMTLFAVTLAANLVAAHLLERPLRWLHRAALGAASRIVDAAVAAPQSLAWVLRSDRVSQRNE